MKDLEKASPDFKAWWWQQDIHGPCQGIRHLHIESIGQMVFEHTTLTIDEDRHLRLVYYAAQDGKPESCLFEQWLQRELESEP
ncbi:MmyB-like transcription regulator ligand binding domain protein [compost metagenome]